VFHWQRKKKETKHVDNEEQQTPEAVPEVLFSDISVTYPDGTTQPVDTQEPITPEVLPPESPTETAVIPASDWNRLYEQFQGFREQFVSFETGHANRRERILAKMQKREQLLASIEDLLDKENAGIEAFKKERLGV